MGDGSPCPITRQPLREPVMCADGHVYEREAIQTWLCRADSGGRSPMTNLPLADRSLTPVPGLTEPVPEPEPEPEPESSAMSGSDSGSYMSRLRASYLHAWRPSLPSLPSSIALPRLDSYYFLPRQLNTRDKWTIIEVSAAYVGLNRSRRVRVARQLDQLETSVLVRRSPLAPTARSVHKKG